MNTNALNVEICTSTNAVTYLYTRKCKGPDRACIKHVANEVTDFLDARYLAAPEACWRIFGFPLHARSHAIERLPVHLPGLQLAPYMQGDEAGGADRGQSKDTKLQAFSRSARSAGKRQSEAMQQVMRRAPHRTSKHVRCDMSTCRTITSGTRKRRLGNCGRAQRKAAKS